MSKVGWVISYFRFKVLRFESYSILIIMIIIITKAMTLI